MSLPSRAALRPLRSWSRAAAALRPAPPHAPRSASSSSSADVKIFAFKCGSLMTQTQRVLANTRVGTPMDIPVTFFVVQHGRDFLAFDTGNNVMAARDPIGYWSAGVVRAYEPRMRESDEFQVQVQSALGLRPADLKLLVLSHGHLDHAGAVDNFAGTSVPIYLQASELDNIRAELARFRATGVKTAYIPGDFARFDELNFVPMAGDGVLDVFGDKSVVLFPSPGHSPGHQSMMVKCGGKTYILTGDADYTLENMEQGIAPGLAWDVPAALQSLRMFKVLRESDPEHVVIVPSHDPAFWATKPLAPTPFLA